MEKGSINETKYFYNRHYLTRQYYMAMLTSFTKGMLNSQFFCGTQYNTVQVKGWARLQRSSKHVTLWMKRNQGSKEIK